MASALEPDGRRRPVVAIVGRPNVGKSSLANRLAGRRSSIVEERPGVTRDRKALHVEWNGLPVEVVDTGGWVGAPPDELAAKVSHQSERAVEGADLILFVVDSEVGVTGEDEQVGALLRRSETPVMVVANKVDTQAREPDAWGAARLGFGDPWMVSALHGRGTGDLLDEVVRRLETLASRPLVRDETFEAVVPGETLEEVGALAPDESAGAPRIPAVSIVGRPNVGKSTLFNRLVGEDRSVTHELPGTTRDAIDTVAFTEAGAFRFIDTAGLRRKSRVERGTEYYSLVRSLRAIDEADVALLLIDSTEGVTAQDQRVSERIGAAGSPVVLVLNKWDVLDAESRARLLAEVDEKLSYLAYAPTLKVSALTGYGVHRLLPAVVEEVEAHHRRVPTSELNRVVQAAQASHPAPSSRILYAVQGAVDPPTFTLFATRPLPAPYLRYLERRLREDLGFGPTPLKMRVRRRPAR